MERVWSEPQDLDELAWWHERPGTTTLVATDGGRFVGTATMSLVRLLLGGEETTVGIATRLATDPEHRGRGVFGGLQREAEARGGGAGARPLPGGAEPPAEPDLSRRAGGAGAPPPRRGGRRRRARACCWSCRTPRRSRSFSRGSGGRSSRRCACACGWGGRGARRRWRSCTRCRRARAASSATPITCAGGSAVRAATASSR